VICEACSTGRVPSRWLPLNHPPHHPTIRPHLGWATRHLSRRRWRATSKGTNSNVSPDLITMASAAPNDVQADVDAATIVRVVQDQSNQVYHFHVKDVLGRMHVVEAGWYLSCNGGPKDSTKEGQKPKKKGCPRPTGFRPSGTPFPRTKACVAMRKVCDRLLETTDVTEEIMDHFKDQKVECFMCAEGVSLQLRPGDFLVCGTCFKAVHTKCARSWSISSGELQCPRCRSSDLLVSASFLPPHFGRHPLVYRLECVAACISPELAI
jgi:hypothetical protein